MSTPAPELKEWDGLRVHDGISSPCIDVKLWKDGMSCHILCEGSIKLDTNHRYLPHCRFRALIDEAERVGRHFWGEEWGREVESK